MKKHNFYAGPSILSEYTIKNTADAVINFAGTGLSLMEISHRSKEFTAVIEEAQALVKELLEVPDGYSVLFLGGGASLQFCMVPYNLLNKKSSLPRNGYLGCQRHQRGPSLRRSRRGSFFKRGQLLIHSQRLYRTRRR